MQNAKGQAVILHGSLSDHLNTDPVQISLRQLSNFRIHTLFDSAFHRLNNGCARGQRLQASIIATATKRAVFIDCHMTEFAGAATRSAVEFTIDKNRCSNSHSYVNIYEIVQACSESKMLLRCRDRSYAVLKQAGHTKFTLQDVSERDIFPFGHLTGAREG